MTTTPLSDRDLAILREAVRTYNNMGRVNGVYANDDVAALLDRVEAAEAKLATIHEWIARGPRS